MKNNKNIDQLFESKLNNQTFELKDSYMADFENKLEVYNKKGKGYFWLIFAVASISLGVVYDFVILPNFNTTISPRIASIKTAEQNNSTNSTQIQEESKLQKESSIDNPAYLNSFDLDLIENKITDNNNNNNNSANDKLKEIASRSNSISNDVSTKARTNKGTDSKTENIKNSSSVEKTIENSQLKNNSIEQVNSIINTTAKEVKTPDVYIDDTIRRQVVVVDTIVRKDTVIITDTIKRKFRLFKKKI